MFKRTNGYILLTLLVLTGFAGRVTNETLHSKERRLLINSLKESRAELLGSINALSDRQLDYRPAKEAPSIRDYVNDITVAERTFSVLAQKALSSKADSDKAPVSDAERAGQLADNCPLLDPPPAAIPVQKSVKRALEQYKEDRAKAIKYIRTTTQDVRSFTTATPSGPADVYQLYLAMCAHQARHNQQIRAIMQSPGFPKK